MYILFFKRDNDWRGYSCNQATTCDFLRKTVRLSMQVIRDLQESSANPIM